MLTSLERQIQKEQERLGQIEVAKQTDPFWDGQAHFTREEILSFDFLGDIYQPEKISKQLYLHNLQKLIKAAVGGYNSGKTRWLCAEGLKHAYLNAPMLCGIISPSYEQAEFTAIETLHKLLNANEIPYNYIASKHLYELPYKGKTARIKIMSGAEPKSCKGPDMAWIGIDEPFIIKEEIWNIAISRVHEDVEYFGIALAGTPEDLNWGYRILVDEADERTEFVTMSARENPFLPDWYVPMLMSQYDKVSAQAYIDGEFVPLVKGRAYHAYDSHNVIPDSHPAAQYHDGYPLCLTFDFNVNPYCIGIGQQFGRFAVVMDEIKTHQADTEYVCREIIEKIPLRAFPEIRIYGDASGNFHSTKSVYTDYEIIKNMFEKYDVDFRVPHSNPSVADRVQLVNTMFHNAQGKRHLFIAERAKNVRNDFLRVQWKEGKRELDKSNPDLTHFSDGIGYWLDYEFGWLLYKKEAA